MTRVDYRRGNSRLFWPVTPIEPTLENDDRLPLVRPRGDPPRSSLHFLSCEFGGLLCNSPNELSVSLT